MEESDPYTVLVRGWQPVIDGEAWLLNHLEQNAAEWDTRHRTTPSWSPGMTGHDPAAASNSVPHPPGTDPATCRNAFIPYVAGEVGRGLAGPVGPLLPRIETWELHTCAIGSFVLRATVDAIDQTAGTATVNIWMQNEMSRSSFGRFASRAVVSGQATQYMWWLCSSRRTGRSQVGCTRLGAASRNRSTPTALRRAVGATGGSSSTRRRDPRSRSGVGS
ncbi:hypothetical protein [Amycolatopsis japonica]|nr:hypothetical protein [Amycolatopsis japonica]